MPNRSEEAKVIGPGGISKTSIKTWLLPQRLYNIEKNGATRKTVLQCHSENDPISHIPAFQQKRHKVDAPHTLPQQKSGTSSSESDKCYWLCWHISWQQFITLSWHMWRCNIKWGKQKTGISSIITKQCKFKTGQDPRKILHCLRITKDHLTGYTKVWRDADKDCRDLWNKQGNWHNGWQQHVYICSLCYSFTCIFQVA